MGRGPEDLDAEAIGREAADRAVSLLGASKPTSRSCPVVFDETVAASFFGFIGGVLCADATQRGRSPFAGRLGEDIASDALTLADDGTDPAGLATTPIDGEGAPRHRTPLIEAGTLAAYLHDSYTARREGGEARSTASAARAGYRSPPAVSTSNLLVEPGTASFEELLREADGGVYVTDVAGLHSGVNPVSGTFSVGATGRLIAGGELAEAADEFTIASDLASMLRAVRATGADARWVPFGGSVKTPPVLIAEMAIGGA
jgi:PmbA protein